MSAVGERIRRIRKSRGMTLTQLAQATDDVAHNISRYERGEVRVPREKVARIAKVLGVDVGVLELGHAPAPAPPRTPEDPILAAFLSTPEGRTVTESELKALCEASFAGADPTELALHYTLMAVRAAQR